MMVDKTDDQELHAIQQVIAALSDLDSEARTRVINYVFQRLGLLPLAVKPEALPPVETLSATVRGPTLAIRPVSRQIDIRTFGQEKNPRSANERVAVVGYYLSELAPEQERKAEMSAADIAKYFKQAGFPLPGAARMTLVNARNAGYLDAGSDRGAYKLNPVGHNLVAHSLPASTGTLRAGRTNRKRARKTKTSGKRR